MFVVVFVVFSYVSMSLFIASVMGAVLSEFLMQFLLALGVIVIYSILFLRKTTASSTPQSSATNTSSPKTSKYSSNASTSEHGEV